jgi:hypothetical protein
MFNDPTDIRLYMAKWESPWSNRVTDKFKIYHASIQAVERRLILEFAEEHGHLPALNNS